VATKPKRTPGEVVDVILDIALEHELEQIDAMSTEELEAEMKTLEDAHGKTGDPEGTKKRGAAFVVAELAHQKRLRDFEEVAVRDLTLALTAAAAAPKTPAMPRKELELRLSAAVKRAPHLGPAVQLTFKKRKREEASDEELRSFIDVLERLEAIARALDGDGRR
jgi:hypothetical protein